MTINDKKYRFIINRDLFMWICELSFSASGKAHVINATATEERSFCLN